MPYLAKFMTDMKRTAAGNAGSSLRYAELRRGYARRQSFLIIRGLDYNFTYDVRLPR